MQGAMASRLTGALQSQMIAAVPTVAEKLAGAEGNIYFRTPGGQAVIQKIGSRFEQGFDIPATEVVEALAKAQMGDFYFGMSQRLMLQLSEAQQQLARYSAMEPNPGGATPPGGGGGGGGKAAFDVGGLWASVRGR